MPILNRKVKFNIGDTVYVAVEQNGEPVVTRGFVDLIRVGVGADNVFYNLKSDNIDTWWESADCHSSPAKAFAAYDKEKAGQLSDA